MSFLDKPVSDMSLAELQRLIRQEVGRQVPAIPTGVLGLGNLDVPLVPPDHASNNDALVFNSSTGQYISSAVAAALADLSVTTAKIAANAVTTAKIAADAVTAGEIAAGAVGNSELAALAVATANVQASAITTAKIATDAVTANEIAALAVGSSELAAAAVTTAKIATDAVTANEIAALAVGTSELAAGAVTAAKITAGTITTTEIAAATILAANIAAATITGSNIAATTIAAGNIISGTITATQIAANTITAAKIAAGTITATEIAAGTITASNILSGTITGTQIAATTIAAANIVANTITASQIAAGTITTNEIAALTIVAGNIAAGAVTSAKITVAQLSAISADMGSITAGTVTGATLRTASADPAVYMDTTGIYAHDANATQTFKIDANTGTFKGSVFLDSAAGLTLTGGVSQPLTAPVTSATVGGSLSASTTYFVTYSWYDGTHETPFYTSVPSRATTVPNKTIQLVLPAAPTGATYARVYMDTSTFVQGAGKLQTLSNGDTKVAVSTSATTTISVSALAAGAASPSSQTIAQQGVFGTTATIQPANATDSTGAHYGWTLEGNGRMRFVGPTINTQFWLYDDFYYTSSHYPASTVAGVVGQWLVPASTGTASQVLQGTSTNSDPGLVQCATGTTLTGKAFLRTNNSFALGIGRFRFSVYFMWDTAPNSTNSFIAAMGLTNVSGTKSLAAADVGIQIQNDTDTSAKIMLASADAATLVTVVSSVTVAGGTWVFAEFEVDAGRSAINWWINGTKQTAITSHIPASGTLMFLQMGVLKTNTGSGTVSRTLNVDSVSLFGDYVTG